MAPSTSRTSAAPSSSRKTRQYQHSRQEYYYENVDPQQQQQRHRQQGGTQQPRRRSSSTSSLVSKQQSLAKMESKSKNGGRKSSTTGIERSYDSVTKAILTAASSFGASSSTTTTSNNINNTNNRPASNLPPKTNSNNTNNPIPPISHSHSNLSSAANTIHSTRESIGASLLYASASMSTDEFEKLRKESRKLREEHDRRISDAGLLFVAKNMSGGGNIQNKQGNGEYTTSLGGKEGVVAASDRRGAAGNGVGSTVQRIASAPSFDESDVPATTTTGRKSSIGTTSSSGMYSSKLNHSHHYYGGINNNVGMVKLTTEGLSKIRDILHIGNTSSNDDAMSFYCSDDKTGKVMRQRISLANNVVLEEADGGHSNSGRAMPQSPSIHHHHQSYRNSNNHHHRDSLQNDVTEDDFNKHGSGGVVPPLRQFADHALPLLEAATKTAVRATMDGVDVAARTVAKVAVQSVEGVGMLAKDLANAKTPARSNVTTHNNNHRQGHAENVQYLDERGRYADYVYDPKYKVVRTPPNDDARAPDHAAAKTPGVLAGAIAAAKCDLSPSNPNSLEFHEGGIPRVLVVHDDWEERAGFIRSAEEAMLVTTGGHGDNAEQYHYAIEAKTNVPRGNRRISNPVDVDEETATVNGEEVDMEVMEKLRMASGFAPVQGGTVNREEEADDDDDYAFNQARVHGSRTHEPTANANEQDEAEDHSEYEDPRNASMWVAVPENYMEEDAPDDYLDTTILRARDVLRMGNHAEIAEDEEEEEDCFERVMHAEDVNMGELLLEEVEKDVDFSPMSIGSQTFFVGNVQVGFESDALSPVSFVGNVHVGFDSDIAPKASTQQNAKCNDDHRVLVEDAKSWTTDSADGRSNATAGGTRIEDLDGCQKIAADIAKGDDSLTSLANALAAAVIKDKHRKEEKKEIGTPYSMNSNRQVMFDLKDQRDSKPNGYGENYASLCLNPSESTDLSHSPPVRIVDGGDAQELRINPSESTDLSLFSNWAPDPSKKEDEAVARTSNDSGKEGGRRKLKGRIILIRIKKKLSKVAKKMLFIKWNKKSCIEATPRSIMVNIPAPAFDYPDLISPSNESIGASVTSSIMTGVGSTTRMLGAVAPMAGSPTHAQKYLYGAINYGHRSSDDSTVGGGDSLPPMPTHSQKMALDAGKEDEFSYLAEAMMRGRGIDEEDSLLLYVTPKVDGTGEEVQFIRSMDGTPVPFREIIDDAVEAKEADGVATTSEVKPNNLSCLFTNEKGTAAAKTTTMEIIDAIEVDGQIVLSPHQVNNNVAHVFRRSYPDETNANLLPGSVIESECDEEDTLCYHDGCTVIHQTSTFGDNTIATDPSARQPKATTTTPANNAMVIGTPILSPDGLPLTRQAKMNGSFLFSPNNMGRADPSIRAKERACVKDGKVKPSITMLPSAKPTKYAVTTGENKLLAIKQRYSNSSTESKDMVNNLTDNKPAVPSAFSLSEVLATKQRVSTDKTNATSTVSDHQAEFQVILNEFQDILNTFSSDGSRNEDVTDESSASHRDEMKTPFVENAIKGKYKKTPYPIAEATSNDDDRRMSSPLVVALNTNSSSPAGASIASITSGIDAEGTPRKKAVSAEKKIPKSAMKTRKGLVKDRVYDIQHRTMATTSISPSNAVTDVNGRLKRNHSYRSKNTRRMTNGEGVLAPRKAVLQTTYIRSVPIGIAKSYSRDSREEKESQNDRYGTSYAAKYSMEVSKLNGNSPDSIKMGGGGSSFSDASSYVSETTECDPFNTLLGKMTSSEDEQSSAASVSDEDKENNTDASSSPAARLLPFKSTTFVRPTEINQRNEENHRAPLSPVLMPMKARSWRELAVKAAAAEKTKRNNGSSARFRSEKSWREVSRM